MSLSIEFSEHSRALPLKFLRNAIAGSQTFQELVAAADAETARESVHLGWDEDDVLPRAIVRFLDDETLERLSTTGFEAAGKLLMFFELPIPVEHREQHEDAYLWFHNQLGEILHEMLDLVVADPSQYLNVTSIEGTVEGLSDPRENNGESFGAAEFLVGWN